MAEQPGAPAGEVYDWYVRGLALLDSGNAGAAAQLLERALAAETGSVSVREALARALFDSGRYAEAESHFRHLVQRNLNDDYAQFGLGLALARQGAQESALEHLAMAAAMRPDRTPYVQALREARATVRHRDGAGEALARPLSRDTPPAAPPTADDPSEPEDDDRP
jgi:tetratricopeptide (TPR) repeat protein